MIQEPYNNNNPKTPILTLHLNREEVTLIKKIANYMESRSYLECNAGRIGDWLEQDERKAAKFFTKLWRSLDETHGDISSYI